MGGIAHIANKPDLNPDYAALPAFQAMLAEFRDRGGFFTFMSYIALLAGIAGIMSTADSALIGVSNTMSIDIFKNWVCPNYSDNKIVYVGKAISVTTMCLCLVFAIVIWETGAEYGVVYTIQQGLLWQAVPAYVFGLYTDFGTNAVLCGTAVGTLVDVILIVVIFGGTDPFPLIDKSWSTLLGVALNVMVTLISQYTIFKEDNSGNRVNALSLEKIKNIMKGVTEPMVKWNGALVWITLILTLVSALHWIDSPDEKLVDEFGEEAVNQLMYNGSIRHVIAGLPDYIFATFMWYVVAVIVGITATNIWTVNENEMIETENVNEKETEDGGILMDQLSTSPHATVEEGSDEDEEHDNLTNGQANTDILR